MKTLILNIRCLVAISKQAMEVNRERKSGVELWRRLAVNSWARGLYSAQPPYTISWKREVNEVNWWRSPRIAPWRGHFSFNTRWETAFYGLCPCSTATQSGTTEYLGRLEGSLYSIGQLSPASSRETPRQ